MTDDTRLQRPHRANGLLSDEQQEHDQTIEPTLTCTASHKLCHSTHDSRIAGSLPPPSTTSNLSAAVPKSIYSLIGAQRSSLRTDPRKRVGTIDVSVHTADDVPEADVAFQCLPSHLKNSNFPLRYRPINQRPRLLPWRIQEAPVRTRSNAARFFWSLTNHQLKKHCSTSSEESHTPLKNCHDCQLLQWFRQAKNNNTFANTASPAESN